MRTIAVLLLTVASVTWAQERKAAPEPGGAGEKKRLGSVTWDLNEHKLIWIVEKGKLEDGDFVKKGSDRYEITPDDAVMEFGGERRGFTREEAASVRRLLDTISLYCVESVVWWDDGHGKKLDEKSGEKHRVEKVQGPKRQAPAEALVAASLRRAIEESLK